MCNRNSPANIVAVGWISLLGILGSSVAADVLSDNLANATAGTEDATVSQWILGSFITDASTEYLGSITLLLANPASGIAVLDLYSDGNLEPGSWIGTLESPAGYSSTLAPTTFLGNSMTLDINTRYWVVLRAESGIFSWAWTADNSGDGTGFENTWGISPDSGASWYTYDTYPAQFSVSVNTQTAPAVSTWGMCILFLLILCAVVPIMRLRSVLTH